MGEFPISRVWIFLAALCAACGSTPSGGGAGTSGAAEDAGDSLTNGGTGGGSSTVDSGGGEPTTCVDLACAAPATCSEAGARPICACPSGYDDVQGDGSLCRDIDECAEGTDDCGELETCVDEDGSFTCMGVNECARAALNDCDANATCTDEKDGYSCECNAPWTGDGETCDCPSGYTLQDGECLGDDGSACEGNDDECLNGHCVDGVCCAQACDSPGTCETADGATCADGDTCAYPVADDGTSCEADSDPCTIDECASGACTDQVDLDCADTGPNSVCTDDTCDSADVTGDPCRHAANTDPCADDDVCTTNVCANKVCDAAPLDCDDASVCTVDSCDSDVVAGDPCVHTPIVCDDLDVCTDDSCHAVDGCKIANNTAPCDDGNPCTDDDHCSGGACVDTIPHACDDANPCTDDACDPLDLVDSPCFTTDNTDPCNDDLSCTATDVCSGGDCTGSGNACGPAATGCSENGPGDRTCTCPAMHTIVNDYCVANTDECLANPCDANATCNDPTTGDESCDTLCTCASGYMGTGCPAGCANIDDCAGDPCGIGDGYATGCVDGVNSYTCQCEPGFVSFDLDGDGDPTCVCDMTGTFAMQIVSLVSWPYNSSNMVDAGSMVETRSWSLVHLTHLTDGTLEVEQYACGGTTPDLCQSVDDVAYNTYFPNTIWDLSSMPATTFQLDLPNPVPGTNNFTSPSTCSLLGMSLTDCDGAWPASRTNVLGGGGVRTNGAAWVNHDSDGFAALSSYSVTTGVSPVCPRPGGGGAYPYRGPGWNFGFPTTRFNVASRAIATYEGDIVACDHIIGDVTGPASGQMQQNTRMEGCNGLCAFAPDTVDADIDPPPTVDDAVFDMILIPDGSDCVDVRAEF